MVFLGYTESVSWKISSEYHPRPLASAEAWVYRIELDTKFWGLLVDERIRYKTLFTPKSDRHDDLDEIIVPIEGRYWVKAGQWSRTLSPGEIALIPRGCDHDSGTATNLVGTHFLVLLFDPALAVLKPGQAGGVELPPGSVNWLKWAFRALRHHASTETFLPLSILPEFLNRVAASKSLPSDATHADPVVTKLIRLLEHSETPDLDSLAHQAGLTKFHLQKRFKAAVGATPLQYANAWKLDRVADELRRSTLPLVDLAAEYGFGDMKHFRSLFERRFGVNPSAYRKNPPPRK